MTIYHIFLLLPPALCHMEMSWPPPLRSKYIPGSSYTDIDYSMTSPLLEDGSNYPCKGYQNDRPIQTVTSYSAGSTYNMSLAGTATHGGGSCQLSLSYDNGATFRVIKSMIGGCPLTTTYSFTIPPYAPSGTALFAWTWQNLVGNREFYMNCAEVEVISSTSYKKQRRQSETGLDTLPYLWRGNLEGLDDCHTAENENVVYPDAGLEVEYGGGLNSSSPPTSGFCDGPTPYGQTYRLADDSAAPPSSPHISSQQPSFEGSTTAMASSSPVARLPYVSTSASSSARSIITVTEDCLETVTMTIYPSPSTLTITTMPPHYTTVAPPAACTGTSASCPCALNYQCQELDPCTWACNAYTTPHTFSTSRRSVSVSTSRSHQYTRPTSTRSVIYTHTVRPTPPSSSPRPSQSRGSASPPQGNRPPYATGDTNRYSGCVPGTSICQSATTWETCNDNDGSVQGAAPDDWVYGYPRDVAAGMQCVTFLSPYSSGTRVYGQQALTPEGYYRDDRIVRARPFGDCQPDGSFRCIAGGSRFLVCDQGGWVDMGPSPPGTTCSNGQFVANG